MFQEYGQKAYDMAQIYGKQAGEHGQVAWKEAKKYSGAAAVLAQEYSVVMAGAVAGFSLYSNFTILYLTLSFKIILKLFSNRLTSIQLTLSTKY
jgi:hypothetical protein